ncbi:MAG: DUF5115 domain-containing protein [Muribaculaceae bacterium]|nr:DUF5115 domain-containing protein [Muribaculaceae bacterium]
MKKFLYIAAMTLLMASCSEDYKDWAEPQSNPQGSEIVFGSATVSGVDLIDYAQLPEGTTLVKVCDMTIPSVNDTNYYAETYIILNGEEYPITNDGYMDAATLNQYVVDHYGRALEQRDIPARVKWVMTNGTTATTMMSDEFIVHVILTPVTIPDLWYLIGPGFGDGSWNNRGMEDVGVSLVPMYGTPGAVTILKYVGYIAARRTFKIIHTPGDASDQFSMIDGAIVRNTGEGGNIRVTEAGYYEITLDTDKDEVTIEKLDITPAVYSQIAMPGDYQGWDVSNNLMTAVNTKAENHDWIVKDLTFTQAALLKFAANGSWDVNWGGDSFPLGVGIQDGSNINANIGTYTVMFNDILGYYYFMEQE